MMNKVQELIARRFVNVKVDRSEMIRKAQESISEAVSAIFETNQFVNLIAVDGCVPHFNDGDICRWGINTQVDWSGEAYYSPAHDGETGHAGGEKYGHLLSEQTPSYEDQMKHPNYQALDEANKLLNSYEKEFEAWDDDQNGTWWIFVRTPGTNNFTIETDTFEHD
jgi:hypothetical protein